MLPAHDQSSYDIRFEWGPTGAGAVTADVAVVVDVLSFTTTLTVAVEKGIEVFPFRWKDARAAEHALRHRATLAVGRFEALAREDARHVSLSPASLAEADGIERLVLPSPNGSTIAFQLAEAGATVVGACLRNATAVGRYVARLGGSVVVIAAGERWDDDSLRPCAEDLWGAGAVLAALRESSAPVGASGGGPRTRRIEQGRGHLSPEARLAVAAWQAAEMPGDLHECASGRELAEAGFADDVVVAAAVGSSDVVPVLRGESFVAM